MFGAFLKNCYTAAGDELRIFLGRDTGKCYGTGN
jgi:hypothetical protein